MSIYWSSIVHEVEPYVPGEQPKIQNLIKLNTNENPYSPSPQVIAALQATANEALKLYPDPEATQLRGTIAAYFGVTPEQVFVGNGSDEVLAFVFQALLKHFEPILFPDITYSFYPVYCRLYEIEFETIPLNRDFQLQIEDYMRPNGGIIFPNPNAPTGSGIGLEQIEQLVAQNQGSVVVIDEAYVDFGGQSAIGLIAKYPNLLVVQTLSKSRSLAGLRVGYAIGDAKLIEALTRIKNSFNSYPLDRFALAGAKAAFEDQDYFEKTCQAIVQTRTRLVADLQAIGFEVLPSQANFVMARHPQMDALKISQFLRENAILVRHFKLARIDQFLRITVGTDAECAELIRTLKLLFDR